MRVPQFVQKQKAGKESEAPQAPSRVLKRAVSYLEKVKRAFVDRPDVYRTFLGIMHSFKDQRMDIQTLVEQVYALFAGHPSLLVGFNTFLPMGHTVKINSASSSSAQSQEYFQQSKAERQMHGSSGIELEPTIATCVSTHQ